MMLELVKLFSQVPEVMQTDLQACTSHQTNTVTSYAQHRLNEHTQHGY